jgi:hypothetical protein
VPWHLRGQDRRLPIPIGRRRAPPRPNPCLTKLDLMAGLGSIRRHSPLQIPGRSMNFAPDFLDSSRWPPVSSIDTGDMSCLAYGIWDGIVDPGHPSSRGKSGLPCRPDTPGTASTRRGGLLPGRFAPALPARGRRRHFGRRISIETERCLTAGVSRSRSPACEGMLEGRDDNPRDPIDDGRVG